MLQIVFLLLSSILISSCKKEECKTNHLPYYNEPTFTPIFIEDKSQVDLEISHQISDFSFINQDSLAITQNIINDKIHIANFIFTTCGSICPIMTKNLKIVSDSLQGIDDVVFLSYSVTPWIDNPKTLNTYKKYNEISNENWHFLTGNKNDIYALARKSYFAEEDIGFSKDSSEFLHTEHIILIDKSKRIRGIYNGTLMLEMEGLLDDIHTLQKE